MSREMKNKEEETVALAYTVHVLYEYDLPSIQRDVGVAPLVAAFSNSRTGTAGSTLASRPRVLPMVRGVGAGDTVASACALLGTTVKPTEDLGTGTNLT